MRNAQMKRTTKETDISISLELDGSGKCEVSTGIGFFDHMLTAFAVHGGFDLTVKAVGDLEVDGHHTVEDTGILLGQTFAKALGGKEGIARYGSFTIPMDEALAFCSLDISARPYLVFEGIDNAGMIGSYDSSLTVEFLRAFATNAGITLHLKVLYGSNAHHMTEAAFKALAHALKAACVRSGETTLSTKGVL
jgi:imidazoleglycerol-phosphate dehydratase